MVDKVKIFEGIHGSKGFLEEKINELMGGVEVKSFHVVPFYSKKVGEPDYCVFIHYTTKEESKK